jgi:hypothetical protein
MDFFNDVVQSDLPMKKAPRRALPDRDVSDHITLTIASAT